MSPSRAPAAGFTLTELVVAILCTAIIAAAAVPNFERMRQDWALLGSANLVAQSLAWGRMRAVATNADLLFDVDAAANRICWAEPDGGECYQATIRHLPAQVRLTGYPRRALRFHPRGTAAPAGTFTLEGDAGVYRVIVSPAGRIRMERQ